MRLVTRGDLDGLTSAVIITSTEPIDEILLIHPQDITDRKVRITGKDILVNVPYDPNCGKWFDHHLLTDSNEKPPVRFEGKHDLAPSAARLVYDYYVERDPSVEQYEDLVDETDRLDSADLSHDDVMNPQGYILLGFTIDNRSGLGFDFKAYFNTLLGYLRRMPIEKVLQQPEVAERVSRLREEQDAFQKLLLDTSHMDGNVVVTDLRKVDTVPAGNRFLIYSLFPDANVSVRIHWGPQRETVIAAVGHSIFKRTCETSIGELMSHFGGGGHRGAGTCKVPVEEAESAIKEILDTLKKNG
jgi:nanoRNase/pAp phosphatase (c-di-AMP/oligoRNAs hydrolase)